MDSAYIWELYVIVENWGFAEQVDLDSNLEFQIWNFLLLSTWYQDYLKSMSFHYSKIITSWNCYEKIDNDPEVFLHIGNYLMSA